MVKFNLPKTDEYTQAIISWSEQDGAASIATDRMHLGSVREIREENGKIIVVAEITEPGLIRWIKENVSESEPIEFEPEVKDRLRCS